jgi:predicted kinase
VNESRLYILCGLPFAGKTTLAKELVKRFGLTQIDVDQINTNFGVGLLGASISPEEWERTYVEAYKQLADALNSRQSVLFEGASYTKELRDRLRAIAYKRGVASRVIYVDISESEARQRLHSNRITQHRHNVRDDNFALVVTYFEPPREDEGVIHYHQSLPLEEWIECHFHSQNYHHA